MAIENNSLVLGIYLNYLENIGRATQVHQRYQSGC
jgi:hypothetical protein